MKSQVRHDIQGLRALAVIAVILDHVLGWPSGGFVGVDVFFVLSGFLITGLLLREAERDGRVSLTGFFGRRVRRIAPAAVLVLVATTVTAWFLFNQPRFWSTVGDAVSALLLVSNWRFAAEGTDYFSAGDAVSPLQHFWTLSVEEQFYLVWPLIVLIVVAVVLGRPSGAGAPTGRSRLRPTLGVVLAVVVVASFVFALWQSSAAPTTAYFSTLTRVWELGAGGLLAVAAPLFATMPFGARVLLGWAGLAGVVASMLLIDSSLAFPGPWAAAPVLATVAVVVAGIAPAGSTAGAQRHLVPIVNPVTTFVGDVSYSLYLWHFPVLVFVTLLLPASLETTLVVLGLVLVVALLSYFLVEQPLHRAPQSPRGTASEERSKAWQEWRDRFGAQAMLSGAALVVLVIAATVVVQLGVKGEGPLAALLPSAPVVQTPDAPAPDAAAGSPGDKGQPGGETDAGSGEAQAPASVNPEDELQAQLYAAAAATAWPGDLSPSLDQAISDNSSHNPARDCFTPGPTPDAGACTWGSGDAPDHLYLVGDSTALSYAPAFKALAEQSGGRWRVTAIGLYGCRFTQVAVQNDGDGVMQWCEQRKADVRAMIAADQPRLVVMSNAYALGNTPDRRPLSTTDLVASTLAEAASYQVPGRVVQLAPPPLGANLGACYSPVTSPQNCMTGIDQAWYDFESATRAALAAAGTGDHYVSSLGFSCAQGYCPAFAGTVPTRYDQVHLTPAYAEKVAPSIRWELAAQGLF
ncbi:acyltransferase family protein [Herbiconiux sp. A18JL235]|uniref:Acyltransferase family protein n=1 Tax=Herbiconiux sp. A18JL235 TaxID=3152363 RepID=A0AB39BLT5_9MICO